MRTTILLAVVASTLSLTGCMVGKAEYSVVDKTVTPQQARAISHKCEVQHFNDEMEELDLYDVYGPDDDWINMDADRHACYQRHGLKLQGYRQRNGHLTPLEFEPKERY